MAFPVVLNGRTYTLADFEGTNYVDGLPDAFEDFVTHAGDIYNDTSTSSASIGTGSKTFTVSAGKPYQAGTPLRIADAAAPSTNFLDAIVTSYSNTTLVVDVIGFGGSGTKTSWTVNIGGAKTTDGTLAISQGGTGATTAAAARTALGLGTGDSPTFAGLTVTGSTSFSDIDIDNVGDIAVDSISGDGDADTTITFAGSDTINIAAGGSTIQSITTTGVDVTGTVTADGVNTDYTNGFKIFDEGQLEASWTHNNTTGTSTLNVGRNANWGGEFIVQTDTKNRANFASNGDISFYEDTGTTAKFFWDASAESLGIGTTSPSALLNVAGANADPVLLFTRTDNVGGNGHLKSAGNTGTVNAEIQLGSGSDDAIRFATAGGIATNERMIIDSSGNVGIGTSNPQREVHVTSAGQNGVRLTSTAFGADFGLLSSVGGNNGFGIYDYTASLYRFSVDSAGRVGIGTTSPGAELDIASTTPDLRLTDTSNSFYGQITVDTNHLKFNIDGSEAMRIDSSRNLLVGTTNSTPGVGNTSSGVSMRGGLGSFFSRPSGTPLHVNRSDNDGAIVDFRKDGSQVGSIGTLNGKGYIAGPNVGVRFGSSALVPTNSTGNNNDTGVDIGDQFVRFKDLYLSGGAYLGGTAAANKLDDYEEGTFTPTLFGSTTAGTPTYTNQSGNYTKIGNRVICTLRVGVSAISGAAGNVRIGGLPFASSGETSATVMVEQADWPTGTTAPVAYNSGSTEIRIFYMADDSGWTQATIADETQNYIVSISYQTTA